MVLAQVAPAYSLEFSICTLVTNHQEYGLMKETFEACGFTDGCEYLIYDNSAANVVDAYQAIAGFLKQAQGRYLVVVHQDVRCLDHKAQLQKCLRELTSLDPAWAICGNAGSNGYHTGVRYLTNNGEVRKKGNLPAKVTSLDENLLIIDRNTTLTISADLKGYHLYGTDLCLIADFLGYTSYVIPFMVHHLSLGNLKDLEQHTSAFLATYGRKLRDRFVETTCTKFYLSNAPSKNKLYNLGAAFGLIKATQRLKQIMRLGR
ncbi:hypothetical protein [Rufibacter sp. LB8]|uniref:hypothetical protein n=1 Tax=Rufibacter sp. LB8 TaxID=2777781 RepID=UPI00178C60FE|nr:hypothetical protein [Rufibacter sp. LB8]